jgi:hypothetical protein
MKKRISVLALVALFATCASVADDAKKPSKYAAMWSELREKVEAKKGKLMEKANSYATTLKEAEDAVKALEKSEENQTTTAFKEKLEIAKQNEAAALKASNKFDAEVAPLTALVKEYKDHEAGDKLDLDAEIDKLNALSDVNDAANQKLTMDAQLAGIERRLDKQLMGAYVREKITAALANTLCSTDEICKDNAGGGVKLRQLLDDRFNSLYFSDEGKRGRRSDGTKTHK